MRAPIVSYENEKNREIAKRDRLLRKCESEIDLNRLQGLVLIQAQSEESMAIDRGGTHE
jgi:hypothetical protein